MARSRKKAPAPTPTTPDPESLVAAGGPPDVFDEAIAAGQPPVSESTPAPEVRPTGFAARVTRPDPFDELTISLSDDPDGPRARLYRSQRFQQVAIRFDGKPGEAVRQQLRDAGWTWRAAEGVWTRQLGERPGETHRQAQELFERIANDMRRASGLSPVTGPAVGR